MIVLPETDRKGARCVVSKLSEAFARHESASTKEPIGGAVTISVTAMDPNSDRDGAAHMRALCRDAEGLRQRGMYVEKQLPNAETMNYLSDFVSGCEAEKGRNWPAIKR